MLFEIAQVVAFAGLVVAETVIIWKDRALLHDRWHQLVIASLVAMLVAETGVLVHQLRASPRSLTQKQAAVIRDALKGDPPSWVFSVEHPVNDSEAQVYSAQLVVALEAAGWRPSGAASTFGINPSGIWLVYGTGTWPAGKVPSAFEKSTADPPLHLWMLAEALSKADLPFRLSPNPRLPPGVFEVIVGSKDP